MRRLGSRILALMYTGRKMEILANIADGLLLGEIDTDRKILKSHDFEIVQYGSASLKLKTTPQTHS